MSSVPYNNKPRYTSVGPIGPAGAAAPNAPAPLVQQMVAQQQQQQPANVFAGGNGIMGRFENPVPSPTPQSGTAANMPATQTFENQPATVGWTPQGQPVYQGSQAQQSWQTTPPVQEQPPMGIPYAYQEQPSSVQQAPAFEKDETKKDGGFFGWLGGLTKKRPGRRAGESDDEYDERMTRNKERIAVLADAVRHMGNIYFTSKGATPQKFNSATDGYELGLKTRKAERKAKAAADADAAYKNANLQMKKDAADAERTYKAALLGYKGRDAERADFQAQSMDAYRKGQLGLSEAKFGETQRHNKVTEGQSAARIALSRARLARSGSSGGYSAKGYQYATPYGRISSAKKMTSQQRAMVWDEMRRLGMITPQKQAELERAMKGDGTNRGSVSAANGIIDRAMAYGVMDASKRGDALRKFLVDGLGFGEYRESNTAQRGVNTQGKRVRTVTKTVSKAQAKKIREQRKGADPVRWQGAATKAAAKKAQGKQGSTNSNDWSQYIDRK